MRTNVASFRDYAPSRLQRQVQQSSSEPRAESIISDMADGILATESIFSFAGFSYTESHLVLALIGIIGAGGDAGIELYDEDIAKQVGCDTRTVQRWRKAYLDKASSLNFWPLEIKQGEYCKDKLRYMATSYRVTFAETLEQIVSTARNCADYQTDRLRAIERAASLYYEDIEQAPPKLRRRKPKSAPQTPLAHLNAASRKLARAQDSFQAMPDRQRNAFINGQGAELRVTLDAMRTQMAEMEAILSGVPTTVETKTVKYIGDKMSGIPPLPENEPAYVVERTKEESATLQEPEIVHTAEAVAAFDSILTRLRRPQVARSEVEIKVRAPSVSPDEPSQAENPDEAPPRGLEYFADDSAPELPDELYFPPEPSSETDDLDSDGLAEAEAIRATE
jgi:hypothetical protein